MNDGSAQGGFYAIAAECEYAFGLQTSHRAQDHARACGGLDVFSRISNGDRRGWGFGRDEGGFCLIVQPFCRKRGRGLFVVRGLFPSASGKRLRNSTVREGEGLM